MAKWIRGFCACVFGEGLRVACCAGFSEELACAVGNLGLITAMAGKGLQPLPVMIAVPCDGTVPGSHFSCAGEFAGTGFSEGWLHQLTVPAVGAIVGGARVRRWGMARAHAPWRPFPQRQHRREKKRDLGVLFYTPQGLRD